MKALCTRWPVAAIMAAALFAAVPGGRWTVAEAAQDPVRTEAEALAQAVSQEFGAVLERQRVAQAPSGGAAPDEQSGAWGWLQRSREQFQALMQRLAGGRPQPSDPTDQPAPKTAPSAGAAVVTTPAERPGEPSPRAGAAVPATSESKTTTETKTAQADTSKPDAAKKPDTPKSDAPKAAPKADAPKPDAPKSDGKAAAPKSDATKSDGKAAAPKSETPKSEPPRAAAPKSEPGKADAKAGAPKAGEPAGAAQGKPPASKAEGTAGPPPAIPPAATDKAPAAKTDAPAAKTLAGTRQAGGGSRRSGSAGRTCRAAGRAIRAPGWYVVGKGDTLSAIARRHYGSGRLYARIRAANRGRIRSADRISVCQRIYLPRVGRRR